MEDIKKELEYILKKDNDFYNYLDKLTATDKNKEELKDQRLIALGKIMALNELKYSITYNDYLYKKEAK